MRVLWITHVVGDEPSAFLGAKATHLGGWIGSLTEAVTANPGVELAIAYIVQGGEWKCGTVGRHTAYRVPSHENLHQSTKLDEGLRKSLWRVVEDFHPDVMHMHGTEHAFSEFALEKNLPPTVISIQGLLCVIEKHYYGGMSWWHWARYRTLRDWFRMDGVIEVRKNLQQQAVRECKLLAAGHGVLGRTLWDYAHSWALDANVRYSFVGELLRRPFFETRRRPRERGRGVLYASSFASPWKGFHVLLEAASILRGEFPELQIRVPGPPFEVEGGAWARFWNRQRGRGYRAFLMDEIERLGLRGRVIGLGHVDAARVAEELAAADVFVMPSFVETGSNATAEAMMVHTPVVAAFAGGLQTTAHDDDTALAFQCGDAEVLAYQIRRLLTEPELVERLTARAYEFVMDRYDPQQVVDQLIASYEKEMAAAGRALSAAAK